MFEQTKKRVEFDIYAHRYSGGMENPVKSFLGKNLAAFIEIKAKWILRDLEKNPLKYLNSPKDIRLLDFGCGTAELLRALCKMGFEGMLEGCDVSKEMLKEAACYRDDNCSFRLYLIERDKLIFADNSFDIVVASSIFHHIEPLKHHQMLTELIRVIKPGGRLIVFEHNPLNPVTKFIVKTTFIDRNAVLINATKFSKKIVLAGLSNIRVNYFLFSPPRLNSRMLESLEGYLSKIPLGGQYALVGEKKERF